MVFVSSVDVAVVAVVAVVEEEKDMEVGQYGRNAALENDRCCCAYILPVYIWAKRENKSDEVEK